MKTAPRTSPGLRQIRKGLGALDAEVLEAIAHSRSPLLDTAMPALSRAADKGKLWFAIAAAMAFSGSRSARRARLGAKHREGSVPDALACMLVL